MQFMNKQDTWTRLLGDIIKNWLPSPIDLQEL